MGNLTEAKVKEAKKVDPSNIMQVGMGFWASKTLLTAVKLELFTLLAVKPLTGNRGEASVMFARQGPL